MHLLEIEARHWRGLTQKVGTLSPRLNAIFGPNESGKSRLFQALRFALFETYKGSAQHKLLLQSRNSVDSPWVRVSFDIDGKVYELTKQYLKGGFAELTGGGATLRNEDAETRLRQLLGTRPGGNREVGAEDMGIWPLLMVRQGASGTSPRDVLTDDSRSKIQARLADEIGAAAISEAGAKLLDQAQAEHDRYFTATGQENTTLKGARARMDAATTRLDQERQAYAKQVDTSTRLTDARKDWMDLQGRSAKAKQEVVASRAKAEAAQGAASKFKSAKAQYELRKAQEDRIRQDQQSLTLLLEQRGRLDQQISALDVQIADLDKADEQLEELGKTLKENVRVADAALAQALEAQGLARKAAQRQRLIEQRGSLEELISKLQDVGRRLEEANAAKAGVVPITDAQIQKLRELDQVARDASAQLAGAAVRVTITPAVDLTIDGQASPAGRVLSLDVVDDRSIEIQGVASLEVRPSLGALDELRDRASRTKAEFSAALSTLGFESLSGAIEANRRFKELDQDVALLNREAKALSAKKLDELIPERDGISTQITQMGEINSELSLDAAIDAAEKAGATIDAARGEKARNDSALSDLRATLSGKRSTRQAAGEQLQSLIEQLEAKRTLEDLAAELATAQEQTRNASVEMSAAEDAYNTFGGDRAVEDLKRLERASESLAQRLIEARTLVDTLQGSLQTLMTEGSYEKMVDAEAEAEDANVQLQRLLKNAAAAKRLYGLLTAERRKVVEQMTAPVIARIRPYLADIFPGSRLVTGENLEFEGLQTQNMQEDFASLSGGAQEQLALMTRIGIAEVLAGDSRLPLILDDGLVNSDPERLRMIHRALDRAGKTLQIILLSCHEVLYDELGADYQVRLEKVRR